MLSRRKFIGLSALTGAGLIMNQKVMGSSFLNSLSEQDYTMPLLFMGHGSPMNAIEDNVIHGGATINGYSGFWLGFIRNSVHGTVTLSNNHMGDPDANEYVTNRIRGSLVCHNNSPAPQVGDSEGEPNVVTGRKVGQCAGL